MAKLAKEYHDGLHHAGLSQQHEDFEKDLRQILTKQDPLDTNPK
jgi:hypothetical protein